MMITMTTNLTIKKSILTSLIEKIQSPKITAKVAEKVLNLRNGTRMVMRMSITMAPTMMMMRSGI